MQEREAVICDGRRVLDEVPATIFLEGTEADGVRCHGWKNRRLTSCARTKVYYVGHGQEKCRSACGLMKRECRKELIFVPKVKNGFVPRMQDEIFQTL